MSKTTPCNLDTPIADKKKFDENWDKIDWELDAGVAALNEMYKDATEESIKTATNPDWNDQASYDAHCIDEYVEIPADVFNAIDWSGWSNMQKLKYKIEDAGGGKIDAIVARPIDIERMKDNEKT